MSHVGGPEPGPARGGAGPGRVPLTPVPEIQWGEWDEPPPLEVPPLDEITRENCEIYLRLRFERGRWTAPAVDYHRHRDSLWEVDARIGAWARPIGQESGWPWCALTYHTQCPVKPAAGYAYTHSRPRWRTAWVIYNPDLIRHVNAPSQTEYRAEQLALALADLASELGLEPPQQR